MAYEPVKPETQELYLKIWVNYAVGHLSQEQLAKLFECSQDTVSNAIQWAAENRTRFQTPILAEAAKESLENRLRELRSDLVRIKENEPINWNYVVGVNRIITDVEAMLWKLQAVIQDRSIITLNTVQVNQIEKAREEVTQGMSDEQKRQFLSALKEITDGQGDNPKTAS